MDPAIAVLSIAGSIASIVGAVYAWDQAGKSQAAADIAEDIKRQLIDQRKVSDLTKLQVYAESAKRAFVKYGSSAPASLAGINQQADAEVAIAFLHELQAHKDYFGTSVENAADATCKTLSDGIDRLRVASNNEALSIAGCSILNEIGAFSPTLRKALTEQREASVRTPESQRSRG